MNGRVGFVDDGQDVRQADRPSGCPARDRRPRLRCGRCGSPAPSSQRSCLSTKPDSFSVSVWIMPPARRSRSADGQAQLSIVAGRRAPVLVQLEAASRRPRSARSAAPGTDTLPFAEETEIHRERLGRLAASAAGARGRGCTVVAFVPVAGPVPPPSIVVMPLIEIASSICCGQMKWMCESMIACRHDQAFAGDDLGARRRSTIVTPGWMSGLPALPMPPDAPGACRPMSALTMPQRSDR